MFQEYDDNLYCFWTNDKKWAVWVWVCIFTSLIEVIENMKEIYKTGKMMPDSAKLNFL